MNSAETPPPTSQSAPGATPLRSNGLLSTLQRNWPIWLVAGVVFANGLLSIATVLAVRLEDPPDVLSAPMPFGVQHVSRLLTLVFGFALLFLSLQLLRRRRTAWGLALALAIAATAAHLGHGHLRTAALAPLLIVVLLLIFRRRFTVRSEPRSIARGFAVMAASLAVAVTYGVLGFYLLDKKDFGIEFTLADSLTRTLREFTLVGNSDLVAHTRHAVWFLRSLDLLGLVAIGFGLFSLFRPVAYQLRTLPQEREQMKRLLEQYGGSAVDYFKLWRDKSYFFSSDRRCGVAYRTVWGVALGLGDPVGPRNEMADFLRSWLSYCHDNGWAVAFHQARPDLLPIYRQVGLDTLKIGQEAVVDLERFTTATLPGSKHMRGTRKRFARDGYAVTWHEPPHTAALLDEAEAVSNEWLRLPGHRERSFSLGDFTRSYLNETPLVAVRDQEGRMLAFVNVIPSFRQGEATIDLMRHRLDAPNGTMDYLFTELMVGLHAQGYRLFNLGMAPFAGVGEEPDAPLQERAAHELSEQLGRWVHYKGIRAYKGKFDPIWEDRYLIYEGGPAGLVKTGLALTRATEG